jgi:hypothetical protein
VETAALEELDIVVLDRVFKLREVVARTRVAPPFALRLDAVNAGRVFAPFSAEEGRPRSYRVHRALLLAASTLLNTLGCDVAYVASDEINLVCLSTSVYGGRVEKLDSIAAAVASAYTSLELGLPVAFDSRIVLLSGSLDAALYVLYRARVAFNNYVSTIYHRVAGVDHPTPKLNEMIRELEARGYLISMEPPWALYGTCIAYVKTSRVSEGQTAIRRRLVRLDGVELCTKTLEAYDEPPTKRD